MEINEAPGKSDEENIEMQNSNDVRSLYGYEEALELTGHGKYNVGLLASCFMVIVAMGTDIFGLGVIVSTATPHMEMTLSQIGILSAMPFAGVVLMAYPWGYLADTRGRKLVLMWAMSGSFVSAALSSLASSWQLLAVLRFTSSALSSAGGSATYALLSESCNTRYRLRYMLLVTSALMITPAFYYLTEFFILKYQLSFTFLGISFKPWRMLTLIMALPLCLSALMLHFFHESPKFLVNVGRNAEAIEVLAKMYVANGGRKTDYPVKEIFLEERNKSEVGELSLQSLWNQIAPIFKQPLRNPTLLLFYLTIIVYMTNNSFAIMLPTVLHAFFTSYASVNVDDNFCAVISARSEPLPLKKITDRIKHIGDNTIWAGCAHGVAFCVLNALISLCAYKRKVLTVVILVVAAFAALMVNDTGEAISGLVLFYVYLTTAMVFGIVSSYFVSLYPTSYRAMAASLGMMVARLSAVSGTIIVSNTLLTECAATLYGGAVLALSGAVAAYFLPSDGSHVE